MLHWPNSDMWRALVQVLYDDGEDEWLDLRAEAARALPPAAVSAGLPTGADSAAAQPLLRLAGTHTQLCFPLAFFWVSRDARGVKLQPYHPY